MNEVFVWGILTIIGVLFIPTTSYLLGRWYQSSVMEKLMVREKTINDRYSRDLLVTTSRKITTLDASQTTLLHTSVVFGPSWGQMFLMAWKSIFGGSLASYQHILEMGRREAILRLMEQAGHRGCTSIVNLRIETSVVILSKNSTKSKSASVEFLAYATGITA